MWIRYPNPQSYLQTGQYGENGDDCTTLYNDYSSTDLSLIAAFFVWLWAPMPTVTPLSIIRTNYVQVGCTDDN
ncbi:hypothetical protein AcW1_001628 [Taiwanofungus camphoratus]|nr:hypothetical protein AcV5_000329 [Antrodia cinnamomea]KAI0945394.1 hypothetical protein AcW1_001628 [Antrodia cinnamomea]